MTPSAPDDTPPLLPGLAYADLFRPAKLRDLDALFQGELAREAPDLAARFARYRAGEELGAAEVSRLLVEAARPLSRFLARIFAVEEERAALLSGASRDALLFKFRWTVLQKRILKRQPAGTALAEGDLESSGAALVRLLAKGRWPADDEEGTVAFAGWDLYDLAGSAGLAGARPKDATYSPEAARERIARLREEARGAGLPGPEPEDDGALLAAWTALLDAWVLHLRHSGEHAPRTRGWASFFSPAPLRFDALVPSVRPDPALPEGREGPPSHRRRRDGFTLTDPRKSRRQVAGEAHYCLLCAGREKDSCSKGFAAKAGESGYRPNPLGVPLRGCPLEEKISEMHELRREGDSLAALAVVCIDNPMLPGTGHRICNDCMKACIFQAQEPVDIPQAETGVLTDVLSMPWGFEIWSLLTRWNPLNRARPFALPYNGRNVLVVGLGPAGYTLAHHLLNEGFGVVAVDGLKIEPFPAELVGSGDVPPRAVRSVDELRRPLDRRVLAGFGGVSEYGITVRWDKNFLDLLHLSLARRRTLAVHGGVRFGGTLTAPQAFDLGFDHVAIAAGAGRPTLVPMKNNLLRGVRQASDFLMALQLTGAFKEDALANLHLELPAIVVGGGLTAIDTATESLAYYPRHVEKVLERFESLSAERGEEAVLSSMDAGDRETLRRMLEHGRAVRAERARAAAAGAVGEAPDLLALARAWGGATVAYRRTMEESPAYRLNHEEIVKAFEEGIVFAEKLEPVECVADEHGAIREALFRRPDGSLLALPCRTLLVAAGTTPNVTYGREHPGSIPFDPAGKFFAPHAVVTSRTESGPVHELVPRPDGRGAFFTGLEVNGKFVTYFGDNHPVYAGSVVKAMASARDGFPHVRALFAAELDELEASGFAGQAARDARWEEFRSELSRLLSARVVRVDRLTPTIVEVVVEAPLAARNFEPGQFFRFQNFEREAPRVEVDGRQVPLLVEPCALTGAWVDREKGLLSMIALELGTSTRLCAALRPGEPVVVMGPTGSPTRIPRGETVVLCGGGLGNAVLFSIGRAARERGNRVLYFAGYKRPEDFYKREEIEAGADVVVYAVDVPPGVEARRPQDRSFVGNIVQAMAAYAEGRLGPREIDLRAATRLVAIGSDRMMAAVAAARHGVLAPYLSTELVGIGSINSPMQCMMKEVCAQCLQRHVDPVTGRETYVFSCFDQDQELDVLDWGHLRARLSQNLIEERLGGMWLDRILAAGDVGKV